MLSLARALMGNPRMLLLDEPCEGLAPIIVENIGDIISVLKKDVAILLTEQNAHFAQGISRSWIRHRQGPRMPRMPGGRTGRERGNSAALSGGIVFNEDEKN
jgi:ABC-type branched-subunit amino acid transport system ATPase component